MRVSGRTRHSNTLASTQGHVNKEIANDKGHSGRAQIEVILEGLCVCVSFVFLFFCICVKILLSLELSGFEIAWPVSTGCSLICIKENTLMVNEMERSRLFVWLLLPLFFLLVAIKQ